MKEFKITFEEFEKHLKHAISIMNLQDKLYGAVSDFNNETNDEFDFGFFPTLLDDVVDLLELLTDDQENHWITYWVFDLNCGDLYHEDSVIDKDGNPVRMKTIAELWEMLKNN